MKEKASANIVHEMYDDDGNSDACDCSENQDHPDTEFGTFEDEDQVGDWEHTVKVTAILPVTPTHLELYS